MATKTAGKRRGRSGSWWSRVKAWGSKAKGGAKRTGKAWTWTKERSGRMYSWIGEEYMCTNCERMVKYREADSHNRVCAWNTQQRKQAEKEKKEQEKRERQSEPPPERKPSQTKTNASRNRQGGISVAGQTDSGQSGGGQSGGRRRGGQNGNGGGARQQPQVAPSGAAAALVQAFQNWANTECNTVAELKGHLLGTDAAFAQIAPLMEEFIQTQIINKKIHPVVAQPIQNATETIASVGHYFSDAYVAFEKVYAARLEHERQAGPKPDDQMFSQVD